MPYEILFTDYVNKLGIVVEDGTINQETSLKIPGRNSTAYGTVIAENFLHLLENFASPSEPTTPVEGQMWYDSSPGEEILKVYNGVNWQSVNGVNKSVTAPEYKQEGDLWIDRENLQLYMYTDASGWVLVGPQFKEGVVTGATPKVLVGIDDHSYNVLQVDINAMPTMIVATAEFTPKIKIPGFSVLKPGMNMTTRNEVNQAAPKYYGIAEKAESLFVNNTTVPAGNFLRSDSVSNTSFHINVQNNTGINYGRNRELSIGVENSKGIIKSNVAGSSVDIQVKNDGLFKTLITADSQMKVGIANTAPDEELDVSGNVKISIPSSDTTKGNLHVAGDINSTSISTGAIVTNGGLGVAKSTTVGENLKVGFVGFDYNDGYIETRRIVPDKDIDAIITGESYIGEENNRFGAVYAKKFFGDLTGTVVGSVSGRAGSANRLANPSTFSFTGDIQLTSEVIFVGQGERIEFPTTLSNAFISNKDEVIDVQGDDELLVNRVRNDIGAKKMQVATLLDAVPIMPVGTVVPYAGIEAPDGWLFCDGSEYSQSVYDKLYEVIGQTYAGLGASIGHFKVPDMRGRFALGAQGMGNNATAANRITGVNQSAANTVGATGGTEAKYVLEENLPDHKHDLYYANNQFYALAEKQFNIVDDEVDDYHFYLQTSGQLSGVGMKNTQGVKTDSTIAQAMDVMNPFQTMNYIIYAGRIV